LQQNEQRLAVNLYNAIEAKNATEQQIRALESTLALESSDDRLAKLQEQCLTLTSELQRTRGEAVQRENAVRADMERTAQRKLREMQRLLNESEERARVLDPRPLNETNADHDGVASLRERLPLSVESFLEYKNDEYQKIYRRLQSIQGERELALTRCEFLAKELEKMDFVRSTRPSLLRILFDLYKTAKLALQHLSTFRNRTAERELPRRIVQDEISRQINCWDQIVAGHKFIVANMFTEVEVLHLGASPMEFEDSVVSIDESITVTRSSTVRISKRG
jgi:exonuclease VII large subunit